MMNGKNKSGRKGGMMIAIGVDKNMPDRMRSPEEHETSRSSSRAPWDDGSEGIPPEAVGYHTGEERCGSCAYWGEDGECVKLKMPTGSSDYCRLYVESIGEQPEPVMSEEEQE